MKTILPPYHKRVDIENKPFGDDYFNRHEFARNLTTLLSNSENSLVFTINGSWGEGKTTFIKLWERELKKDDRFIPVYYDAFSNDFANDVFISIAATIQNAIVEYSKEVGNEKILKENKQKALKSASIKLADELIKVGSSSAVSFLSSGYVDPSSFFRKLIDFFKKVFKSKKEIYFDDKFDAFTKLESTIDEYQTELQKLLKLDSQEKKIVFFVDELDRCRPDFAIEIIEKVKHLFEVPNVNFVLSINKNQITKTISEAYGVGPEDAGVYLQKFIHLETELPAISNSDFSNQDIQGFINYLAGAFKLDIQDEILILLKELVDKFKGKNTLHLTPRSIERVMTLVSICMGSCSFNKGQLMVRHFFLLALLKVEAPALFDSIKTGKIYDKFHRGMSDYRENQFGDITEWLKTEYFNHGEYEQDAGNIIDVPLLREAGKIIDMYSFPEESKKTNKEYKTSDSS